MLCAVCSKGRRARLLCGAVRDVVVTGGGGGGAVLCCAVLVRSLPRERENNDTSLLESSCPGLLCVPLVECPRQGDSTRRRKKPACCPVLSCPVRLSCFSRTGFTVPPLLSCPFALRWHRRARMRTRTRLPTRRRFVGIV